MRILVIPRDFPTAEEPQAGIFVLRQIQALQELGHELRVVRVVPKAPPLSPKWRAYRRVPDEYSHENVQVRTLRAMVPPRMLGIGIVRAQIASALRREAKEFGADIAHAHCLLPTAALVREIGVPIVLTGHGTDTYRDPWRRVDLRLEARAALTVPTAITAVSEYVKQSLSALGRKDVSVIYNGADEDIFSLADRSTARVQLGIAAERSVIAYTGNLLRAKGVYELAEALVHLRDLQPIALIAGDGPEAATLEQRMRESSVEARLLGRVSQAQLSTMLAASDVFAFPSHAEGLPNAVCEAMLSGRAVVATCVGGIPEIVNDRETGLLVPVADPRSLANALRRVLTDEAIRTAFERKAQAFARKHLTWRVNAAAYNAIYHRIAARSDVA